MEDAHKLQTATQFKQLAESKFVNGDLPGACFYFINCLKVLPEWKNELKSRFLSILSYAGQCLEDDGDFNEIFALYTEALKLYEDCEEINYNVGAHSLRLGSPVEAIAYFKTALELNENYLPAYRGLNSSYCALVKRWHYRMLNDSFRNFAYRKAIARKISEGFDRILDIGTGTGLFCLYAVGSGAERVYGCDDDPIMFSIALQTLANFRNPKRDRMQLIDRSSHDLTPGDIHGRVSLVVTETMDACMLGEHMLQTLKHAWRDLLHPPFGTVPSSQPSGMVIPSCGRLRFTILESKQLARNYMFPLTDINADECVEALANISLNGNTLQNFQPLNLQNLKFFVDLDEPYDTERLQTLPNCTFLAEPHELFHVNFNDPEDIESFLRDENGRSFEVTCAVDGYFHAIAAWFHVKLDEDTELCSAPYGPTAQLCCWDQAVFPSHQAVRVVRGCKISLQSDWTDGKVKFYVHQIAYPNGVTQSMRYEPMKTSSGIVSMLSDVNLLENLKNAAVKFLEGFRWERELRIMDFFPVPVFGLTVLRNILLTNGSLEETRLVCIVRTLVDVEAIMKLAENNGVPASCLSYIMLDDVDEYLPQVPSAYFDAIVLNLLDKEGDLSESMIGRLPILERVLKVDGVMLPKRVEVCGLLVHSDDIERNMRVVDVEVNCLNIGKLINEFQVSQMVAMNYASLNFEKYSNAFVCHQFSMDDFDCEFLKEFFVPVCRQGSANSVIYWFNVYFCDENRSCSTLEEFSYVNQAAFLTESPIKFKPNDNAVVQFVYHRGIFVIKLKNCDNCSF